MPFDGTRGLHLVCSIVNGDRPAKPKDAATIGLSDSLWKLLQACWDADRSKRPRMQYVQDQISNAAAQWERQTPRRRSVPLSFRSGGSLPNPLAASSSSSSTGTRNSSASDQSQTSIPIIRIDVVAPEEDGPSDLMQEFYPPPSPISPSQPGSSSNEAMINRLDGVSSQVDQFDRSLTHDSGSRTRFRRRTRTSKSIEQVVQIVLPSPEFTRICQDPGLLRRLHDSPGLVR